MKHKFFSLAKSVIIASALLIPFISSAESYSFSVTRNSAVALQGNCDYQRGAACFGGFGNIDEATVHLTQFDPLYSPKGKEWLKLYLPARTAQVLRRRR